MLGRGGLSKRNNSKEEETAISNESKKNDGNARGFFKLGNLRELCFPPFSMRSFPLFIPQHTISPILHNPLCHSIFYSSFLKAYFTVSPFILFPPWSSSYTYHPEKSLSIEIFFIRSYNFLISNSLFILAPFLYISSTVIHKPPPIHFYFFFRFLMLTSLSKLLFTFHILLLSMVKAINSNPPFIPLLLFNSFTLIIRPFVLYMHFVFTSWPLPLFQ